MAKVLLSFLGTGLPNNDKKGSATRDYKDAKYKIGDNLYETSFVSTAIAHHHSIDKIILIGTAHSMWEEVYRFFYERNHSGDEKLENNEEAFSIYESIDAHCHHTNYNSPLTLPYKEEIEKEMGGGSKIILINYGINEVQIKENSRIILKVEELIDPKDELIVDITHSFRSIPIYVMNLLVYLQNVSTKKIRIPHIYYGMNEVRREMDDISPVVDLKSMLELQDWIIGAYSMKEFGNSYKIADLLKNQTPESSCDKAVATQLETFSDYVNLNYMDSMMKVIQSLNGIHGKCENEMAKLVVNPVIEDFLKKFKGKHFTDAAFLFRLSEWLFKNKKYAQSYLTALEAIISYAIDLNGYVLREERENNEIGNKNSIKFYYTKDKEIWDSFALRTAIPIVLQKNLWKNGKRITEEEYFQDNLVKLKASPKSIEEKFSLFYNLNDLLDDDDNLKRIYSTHNKHRNQVAHLITARSDGSTYSSKDIIKTLRETLDALKKLIK